MDGAVTRLEREQLKTRIVDTIATWPGVALEWHGPRFVEFKVGRREVGHLHGADFADLPFPVRIREELVTSGKAQLHHRHPETGWVSYYITSPDDLSPLLELFRLNYERPWLTESARS